MQIKRENKGKKMAKYLVKVSKTYETRSLERKFMGYAMKSSNSSTIKRRRSKKGIW